MPKQPNTGLLKRAHNDIGVDVRVQVDRGQRVAIWGLFDAHSDNANCDHARLTRDIARMAEDPEGRVVIGGDFNDMMYSMSDFRRLPSVMADYIKGIDDMTLPVVCRNLEILWPIRNKIDAVLYGNHESAYEKRNGTNVTSLTVLMLNMMRMADAGLPLPAMQISKTKSLGRWNLEDAVTRAMYSAAEERKDPNLYPITFNGYMTAMRYYVELRGERGKCAVSPGLLHHGAGGDAPVTKGAISITRFQHKFPGAEWMMSGHIHKLTLNDDPGYNRWAGGFGNMALIPRPRLHISIGPYLKNYPGGRTAPFSVQHAHSVAPLGAKRLFLYPEQDSLTRTLVARPDFQ